jgi:hypothetical protein
MVKQGKNEDSDLREKRVFVLGAGFTRAFLPRAPLMVDDYDAPSLAQKFKDFEHASRILDWERARESDKLNIERLMTRLYGGMPYDFHQGANEELGMLLAELKKSFVHRIEDARKDADTGSLLAFARFCVRNHVTCITLNYDDVLDEALYKVSYEVGGNGNEYWYPDGGYGFFCKSSEQCVHESIAAQMDIDASMLLLKLHGSINWFPKLGYPQPYAIDALVHREQWLEKQDPPTEQAVALHIEPEPFMVPPVLTKSAIVEQPVLRVIWHRAYQSLRNSSEVTFVEYSLPITDVSVTILLFEALQGLPPDRLRVVNIESEKQMIEERYRKVLGAIPDENFEFNGALDWARSLYS